MKIGILTIGDELTTGRIQDVNSAWIAQNVNTEGWRIAAMLSVGDEMEDIRRGLHFLMGVADVVITTGGLGPTADDMTTQAIAEIFGRALFTDETTLATIKARFEKFKIEWSENNAKQAIFPQGAEIIPNPVGVAAGFVLRHGEKMTVTLPGVPSEVRGIWPDGVLPVLRKAAKGPRQFAMSKTLKLFGIAESRVDQIVAGLGPTASGVTVGFYPRYPETHVVISAQGTDEAATRDRLDSTVETISNALKPHLFGYDDETLEGIVAGLLTEKRLTLSVAESLTGGLITDRLTDVPGSSAFLNRGIIAYSNDCKIDTLGVPAEVIAVHGAVSEETARLMAEGARRIAQTDLGLATTGIAGPTGGSDAKPVGTVFIAVAGPDCTICRHFAFRWDRRRWIKEITSQHALDMIRSFVMGDL